MTGFLTSSEMAMIRRDFASLIAGAEGTPITIRHRSSITGGVWDDTYEEYVGGVSVYTDISARSLQYHINERDKDLLEFAFVKMGDCLFSVDPSVDLDGLEEVTIIDPDGVVWVPVTDPTRALGEYIDVRVGSVEVAQTILTRLQQ